MTRILVFLCAIHYIFTLQYIHYMFTLQLIENQLRFHYIELPENKTLFYSFSNCSHFL